MNAILWFAILHNLILLLVMSFTGSEVAKVAVLSLGTMGCAASLIIRAD
jgi:hypothetical protein